MDVADWLAGLYGSHNIPAFEINEHTLMILNSLREINTAREQECKATANFWRQAAEQYKLKGTQTKQCLIKQGNYIEQILDAVNLDSDSAPLKPTLQQLASLVTALDIRAGNLST